jgi:hypothetical protein
MTEGTVAQKQDGDSLKRCKELEQLENDAKKGEGKDEQHI